MSEELNDQKLESQNSINIEEKLISTSCDHYWVEDSYQPNDLLSIVCTKCPSGCQIGNDKKIIDGKIV